MDNSKTCIPQIGRRGDARGEVREELLGSVGLTGGGVPGKENELRKQSDWDRKKGRSTHWHVETVDGKPVKWESTG